ncbi:2352_t:CDS:2, partial [Ambispora leptoticha]
LSVTSWFIKPTTLFGLRALFTIYSVVVLCLLFRDEPNVYFFHYFSNWCYIGLVAYFILAAFYSKRYLDNGEVRLPTYLNNLFWILYHTICHYQNIRARYKRDNDVHRNEYESSNICMADFIDHDWITVYHYWVYPFLSWDNGPIAAVWYVGLFIFFILAYVVQFGLHKLRDTIGSRLNKKTFENADDV